MDPVANRAAYRIETERLVIRCASPADAPRLRAAIDASDAWLRPWIPWMRHEPKTLYETAERLRKMRADFDLDRDCRYVILDRDERQLLGETGLYPRVGPGAREIGYWLERQHSGRGYAVEAASAMVKVAFDLCGVDRVEIHCAEENTPSVAIPRKLGFTHEATLRRRALDAEDRLRDLMIWTLFADAYAASPARELPLAAYDCIGARIL